MQLVNPRKRVYSSELLTAIQQQTNTNKLIGLRDFQQIGKDETQILKDGEETKTKTYSCVVWTEKDYSAIPDDLAVRLAIKDVVLQQKTPIRVMHRRSLSTRERAVYSIRHKIIKPHYLQLWLSTQAGTYIKEFVHGDFGRTVPNLCTILECKTDILSLDVEEICLPWPPTILVP